jgi:hypothetical protein
MISDDFTCPNFCANALIGAMSSRMKAIFFNIILFFISDYYVCLRNKVPFRLQM